MGKVIFGLGFLGATVLGGVLGGCSSPAPSGNYLPEGGTSDTGGGGMDTGGNNPDSGSPDTAGTPDGGKTDAAKDGGKADGGKADGGDAGPHKRVFTSSKTYPGQIDPNGFAINGVDAADMECNNLAFSASLGGTWVAWLSDTMTDATTHVQDASPWYLVDGTTLAFPTFASLTSFNGPMHAIDTDETNFPISGVDSLVWTGTSSTGSADILNNCSDWTKSDATQNGAVGDSSTVLPNEWTEATPSTDTCDKMHHIYCFEQ